MQVFFFYLASFLAIGSALAVVFVKKPTRALLALLLSMICMAILFTLLGAYFVAIVHIIVYCGAVLVLFLFVIMLQGLGAETLPFMKRFSPAFTIAGSIVGIAFIGMLCVSVVKNPLGTPKGVEGTAENVGLSLFTDYLLPFELISVLLLLGIFAAIALAKTEKATEL